MVLCSDFRSSLARRRRVTWRRAPSCRQSFTITRPRREGCGEIRLFDSFAVCEWKMERCCRCNVADDTTVDHSRWSCFDWTRLLRVLWERLGLYSLHKLSARYAPLFRPSCLQLMQLRQAPADRGTARCAVSVETAQNVAQMFVELHLISPATGEWPSRSFKVIGNGTNQKAIPIIIVAQRAGLDLSGGLGVRPPPSTDGWPP